MTYATIGRRAQRVSQLSFLRLAGARPRVSARSADAVGRRFPDRGRAGRARGSRTARRVSPHPLCPSCRIGADAAGFVEIDTTRPELIPACVALVAHPDDPRYQPLFGTEVVTPLFGVRVPIRAHTLADPEKGTGVAMICTFGDITDVVWWRELGLPVRAVIQANGAFKPVTWGESGWESVDAPRAQRPTISWLDCRRRRRGRASSSCCARAAISLGEPRPITHAVKFYEKGDRPLEIVTSRQWFIKTMDVRARRCWRGAASCLASDLHAGAARELDQRPGRRLVHQPSALLRRAVSRLVQGRGGRHGRPRRAAAALRGSAADRSVHRRARRATARSSAISPEDSRRSGHHGHLGDIVAVAADRGGWIEDPDLFARVFPMDVRPQAHDIIRTWLFSHDAARRISNRARSRGRTPRCRAGCSIRTARRCRSRRATS